MTFKQYLTTRYGSRLHQFSNRLKRLSNQIASAKNRTLFLERCRHHKITPRFLNIKCPISSPHARKLTKQYQHDILRETLKQTRAQLHQKTKQLNRLNEKIREIVSPEDFEKIQTIVNKSRDRTFNKLKEKLRKKFDFLLKKHQPLPSTTRPSSIKNTVLQLQNETLTADEIALLSLGPQFNLTPKEKPYLDIVSAVEAQMSQLEFNGKSDVAKQTRHEVCNALLNFKDKPKSNLTFQEHKGLSSFMKRENVTATPHDKGKGLVVINSDKLQQKAIEAMDNVTANTPDKTKELQKDINAAINKLVEEEKLTKNEAKNLKTPDPNPPSAWTSIKAHKPQKEYPGRNIISHIGCPQEPIAKELIRIIKPLNRNCKYNTKNSSEIAASLKPMILDPNDILVSYDATALYPSIPLNECINLIVEKLKNDATLSQRTKLTPQDILHLLNLCLTTSQFIFNGTMYSAKDSGPIGLSLMVTVADIWMSHTLDQALKIASEKNFRHPKFLKKYVDDILAIFRRQPSTGLRVVEDFLACLNQVHHRVQFTIEYEQDNSIAFLDCHIKRLDNGKLTTTVYRKPSDTNLVMRPNSCQNPDSVISTFKGFLCRAHRLCSTAELLKQEINCLLDIWEDNSHDRKILQKIADTYKPPPLTTDSSSSYSLRQTAARQQRQQQTQPQPQQQQQQQNSTKKQQIVLPFVPGLSPAIRRILKKAGIVTIFTPGPSLQNIICAKNKTKFPPRQVIYKLTVTAKMK